MIAHSYERPLGQIVEELLIVDPKLYVKIVKQAATEPRTRSVKIMIMNPIDLINVKHLHYALHEPAFALEKRRHLYYVVVIEHSALHWGVLPGNIRIFHSFKILYKGNKKPPTLLPAQ